jgi:hypothetical protein
MMQGMMDSNDMMWGMGLGGLIALILLILIIAALVKYVFFDERLHGSFPPTESAGLRNCTS